MTEEEKIKVLQETLKREIDKSETLKREIDRSRFERLRNRDSLDRFDRVANQAVKNFSKDEADHEFSLRRLDIAKSTINIMSWLLAGCLCAVFFLDLETEKKHILSIFISSIFSIITLAVGFVAGSNMDKK